jgi:universal stress protein A
MLKPTKILVPTDFSEFSDKALEQALDIAKQYKARVYVLHVIHEHIFSCGGDYCFVEEEVRQIKDNLLTAARENLQKQLDRFPQVKEVEVITDIRNGLPYDAILKGAEEKGIDLIVIASLGQSGIAKYLIGGVARNVLRGAKCPVLLTK